MNAVLTILNNLHKFNKIFIANCIYSRFHEKRIWNLIMRIKLSNKDQSACAVIRCADQNDLN